MQLPHRKPLLRPITPSASSSSTPTPLPAHLQAVSWRGFGRWWPLPLIGRRRFGGEVQGFLESGAAEHGKMSQVVLEIVSKYRTFDNIGKNRLLVCPEFFVLTLTESFHTPGTTYRNRIGIVFCFIVLYPTPSIMLLGIQILTESFNLPYEITRLYRSVSYLIDIVSSSIIVRYPTVCGRAIFWVASVFDKKTESIRGVYCVTLC